jgi:hypothetical protein
MIKNLILIITLLLAFNACSQEEFEKANRRMLQDSKFIEYVEFNKHRYIIYRKGHYSGIAHDPDCPLCETKNK